MTVFFIDRDKCIDFVPEFNKDLEVDKSKIIRENFQNPRWESSVYNDAIFTKMLLFSKKFNFLKNPILSLVIHKLKLFLIKKKLDKKLKKYFT